MRIVTQVPVWNLRGSLVDAGHIRVIKCTKNAQFGVVNIDIGMLENFSGQKPVKIFVVWSSGIGKFPVQGSSIAICRVYEYV